MHKNRYDPAIHHRRSIRLPDYDYTQARLYFVTLCAFQRQSLFGASIEGQIRLTDMGRIVQETWHDLPNHHAVTLDEFVMMPNHVHGLIALLEQDRNRAIEGEAGLAPTRFGAPPANSLGSIIGSFKSASTRKINKMRCTTGETVWQRDYYERVIRDEHELARAREYIMNNPLKWDKDADNPLNSKHR